MIDKLMKRFALSEEGAKGLVRAVIACAVAETGTPAELMKQGRAFFRMVKLQTESQNWTL